MSETETSGLGEMERQGRFARIRNSIRTQYAVATVLFLLLVLAAFYIGGRIVLVHLVKDAETQMGSVGLELSRHAAHPGDRSSHTHVASAEKNFSVEPLVSRALSFYSGGFWNFDDKPLEAVYAVRDAQGKLLSTVEVQIPNNLAGLTRAALFRLGGFIALAGILLVILLFFLQSRLLLDPLTRMTKKVSEVGKHNADVDCPRLEGKGKDEFAQLAVSVNRMLETISRRSLAIAQAEARHQELINSLPDELLVFDSDGRFISIMKESEDDCQLPGLYPGEPLAEGVYGLDSVQRFNAALAVTLRTGKVGKLRLNVQRPLGASRSVLTRHFDVRLVRIDEYFALAMVADTTDEVNEHNRLRLAEARIAEAKKRESLTLLAAGIAHDMNNVLSVVLNVAESDRADPSGDSAKALETIRDAVRRGAGMMRELQAYAGENRVSLHRMNSGVIVDDIRLLAEQLFPQSILVSYDKSEDAPDVDADPNQFWKVIFNIAKNAGEAIGRERPGRIVIGCARMEMTVEDAAKFLSEKPLPPGTGTVFTVRDDGPGIRSDLMPRLFDPYVSSRAIGRGLGLATVRTIVEAHGGGIRVTSHVGTGTLFEVYLPESRLQPETPVARTAAPDGPEKNEVLIIDDDVSILRTTAILLKSMKIVAHVAKDHTEAMAIVRRHSANLQSIILDADLGGIDTVRLLGSIRNSAPTVPVIVSTGSAEDQIRKLFASQPYDFFMSKPYTLDELKRILATASRQTK